MSVPMRAQHTNDNQRIERSKGVKKAARNEGDESKRIEDAKCEKVEME